MMSHNNDELSAVDFIAVGIITGAFGVHGVLRIKSLSQVKNRFSKGRTLILKLPQNSRNKSYNKYFPQGVPRTLFIERIDKKIATENLLISVKEVQNRESAKVLSGSILGIDSLMTTPALDSDNFFHYQLIGLKVFLNAKEFGIIVSVRDYGAGDLLEIQTNVKEYLIPFTRKIVPEVNLKERYITINPPKGLLEQ